MKRGCEVCCLRSKSPPSIVYGPVSPSWFDNDYVHVELLRRATSGGRWPQPEAMIPPRTT